MDHPALLVSDLASMLNDLTRGVRVAAAARLAHLPIDHLTDGQRKAYEQAMVEFRDSQELSLDHAGSHLSLATLDRQHGRVESAMNHLTAAIALEPILAGRLRTCGKCAAASLREIATKLRLPHGFSIAAREVV
jgi:hypothetical protein